MIRTIPDAGWWCPLLTGGSISVVMKKRGLIILVIAVIVIGATAVWHTVSSPSKVTIEPDHIDILVSLDGEYDEYYEELKLKCNGLRVNSEKVSWKSDDPDIAEVDEYGWVTSMGVGSTTITAQYKGCVAECVVKVTQKITSDTLGE